MIGKYFIQAIFSNNSDTHYVKDFMPADLFSYLEEEAQKKFGRELILYSAKNRWNLDRHFVTINGAIEDIGSDEKLSLTLNFHVGKSGEISNITMDDM